MELVLSPGNLGGGGDSPDGGPFRNEDVREWSRVDRITGMLERARVETGRWRADIQGAKQSYGKMTDSRERNTADGSLVQKARRQVEIFQSQENSGRSFQVVRASQWSSSRARDCGFDIPITYEKSINGTQNAGDFEEGLKMAEASLSNRRMSDRASLLWRSSLSNEASSDLEQLSCLCRKLHNEALNTTKQLWSLRHSPMLRSPSLSSSSSSPSSPPSPMFHEIETESAGSGLFGERLRSNSTDDLSSLPEDLDEAFNRDCKTRRSLQIGANSESRPRGLQYKSQAREPLHTENRTRQSRAAARQEFIAERARRFEEFANEETNGLKGNLIPLSNNAFDTFAPIANNDFVKNDPKYAFKLQLHPNELGMTPSPQENIVVSGENGQTSPVPATRRKANNKTVVHLRNAASPNGINVTANIKLLDNDSEQTTTTTTPPVNNNENGHYAMLMDSSSSSAPVNEETSGRQILVNAAATATKPVKKVEFCKTEIHFAADSGKVNIVETDGKPPPTNKFRRRRRRKDSLLASTNAIGHQKQNMPLVHFGDTSYEKYIFAGQGKPPAQETKNKTEPLAEAGSPTIDDTTAKTNDRQEGVPLEKFVDHSAGRQRGTHTTTVNFLNDESSALSAQKVLDDKPTGDCFPPTSHVVHKEIGSLSKRGSSTPKSRIQPDAGNSNDLENQVFLKIVTTHKPVLARVDSNRSLSNRKPVRLKRSSPLMQSHRLQSSPAKHEEIETKDEHCDNGNGVLLDESECSDEGPTYENIFDAVSNGTSSSGSDPLYENFQAIKSQAPAPIDQVPVAPKKRPSSSAQSGKSVTNSLDRSRHKKLSSKQLTNGHSNATDESTLLENKAAAVRVKTDRNKTSISSRSDNKNALRSVSADVRSGKSGSSRLSGGSRDSSIKRYSNKEAKPTKDDTARGTQAKRKSSFRIVSAPQQGGAYKTAHNSADKNDGSLSRSKKPVEVVYQTAVFNMKNEKLSKQPAKGKEAKGPRLINDLISRTNLIRPSDSKMVKTAVVSQNTSKRKETPTTVNKQ